MTEKNKLIEKYHSNQESNIYFLMAVSASAIGFAFTQAKVEPLTLNHASLALALALWAASFYCGNESIQWSTSFVKKNADYLSPNFFPELTENQKITLIQSSAEHHSKKIILHSRMQNHLLILGAFSYSTFHILSMLSVSA
ncbi:hypothetical protein [Aquipseudomonas alcaligenes]|jgi:hypothetical protein|uniref:hypothetical protein n=1 Tax=Aquipseudomonas alcaligenes TaxID=43263 RepID=UPI0011158508|nr:hypothetical protein [Pseudomonas alcaligenes]